MPLLESMYYDVPILAFDAGAVKDTLDGAGILFKKDFPTICECILKILSDKEFREKILVTKERLDRFQKGNFTSIIGYAIKYFDL